MAQAMHKAWLERAAKLIIKEAQRRVPYKPVRKLMKSADWRFQVKHAETRTSERLVAVVEFGGPGVTYAAEVHEVPKNYRHGRTHKYLTRAISENAGKLRSALKISTNGVFQVYASKYRGEGRHSKQVLSRWRKQARKGKAPGYTRVDKGRAFSKGSKPDLDDLLSVLPWR